MKYTSEHIPKLQIHQHLLPVIEKEIRKLLKAKIIIPLMYSKCIANLVVVRKKNGEIRLCVDFRNLNKCSKKDNYPLRKMEHLLQRVSGASVMSFLDTTKLLCTLMAKKKLCLPLPRAPSCMQKCHLGR